ncbi:hypothetical protein [Pseudomonas sp. CJQ_13]|uniref:hypothetical protein n=1 Tax=Pseudomonas sp. CJQ_13 TaxID=3367170 RepID=UPI003709C91C
MAMFEVEGQSKITADDCTTTAETLIKSTGSTSKLEAKATNCHTGVSRTDQDKPVEPSFGRQALKWTAEAAIKWAVAAVLPLLAATAAYYWPEIKNLLN